MYDRMRFGKYKGWPLEDIPTGYLHWLLTGCDNLDGWLRRAVQRELGYRREDLGAAGPPKAGLPASLPELIRSWHRELVLIYHPDRGGDTRVMQALNDAFDRLKRLAGCA